MTDRAVVLPDILTHDNEIFQNFREYSDLVIIFTGFLTAVNHSLKGVVIDESTTANMIAPVFSSFEHRLTKTENLKETTND